MRAKLVTRATDRVIFGFATVVKNSFLFRNNKVPAAGSSGLRTEFTPRVYTRIQFQLPNPSCPTVCLHDRPSKVILPKFEPVNTIPHLTVQSRGLEGPITWEGKTFARRGVRGQYRDRRTEVSLLCNQGSILKGGNTYRPNVLKVKTETIWRTMVVLSQSNPVRTPMWSHSVLKETVSRHFESWFH